MKVKQLTQKQRSKLAEYRHMYLNKFFKPKSLASKKEVKDYMQWFYSTFNVSKNKTPYVFLFNSPIELLAGIHVTKRALKAGNEVENEVGNEVENEVETEVWNEVRNEVRNEVWNEVGNEVWNEVDWFTPSYYLSAFNSWVSFYDFFDKECFKLKDYEIFNEFKKILDLNIFWSIPFENAVFVSHNAVKYLRDDQKRLHCINGPAVLFRDGYSLYFIHGVGIKRGVFKKIAENKYVFEDFLKEKNEEVKAAILSFIEEKYGGERLFRFLSDKLKETDTYIDKKDDKYLEGTTGGQDIGVYTLFKGKVDSIELSFVRCFCPSTDRMFFLSTEPIYNNAKDAIASLYRVPAKLKDHIKYIQRQGERYSTVFTDEGNRMLKSLSKKEVGDLTSLPGEDYFRLMRYEY